MKNNVIAYDSYGYDGLYRPTVGYGISKSDKEFNYVVDQFADLEILRYKVPGLSPCPCNKSNYYIIFPKRP